MKSIFVHSLIQKLKLYISTIILLIILFPNISNSQSIEFEITDCLIYINGEIEVEKTREAREDCSEEDVIITFYPDTDIVELELKVIGSGFNDKVLKLDKENSSTYKTNVEVPNNRININLNLNKIFGYIQGGKINMVGRNKEKKNQEVIVEFERK